MKKVVKFGGSSLASAEQFRKLALSSAMTAPGGMWCRPRPEKGIPTT